MKRYCQLIFFFSLSLSVCTSQMSWNKSIDFNGEANNGYSILEFDSLHFVVGALTYTNEQPAGVVLKTDKNGEVLWDAGITYAEYTFYLYESFKIFSNQIWTTGLLTPSVNLDFFPAIVVHNDIGEELWRKEYDFTPFNVNFNTGIRVFNDTTIIVFYHGYYINHLNDYIHRFGYMLTDTLGNEISRNWFPSNYNISYPADIQPFPGGGYILSTVEIDESQGLPFEYEITLKRLDDTFGIIWEEILPLEEFSAGKLSFDPHANIYLTWTEDKSNPGVGSPLGSPAIISYNQSGEFRWKYIFDDNPRHRFLGNILTTSEGNIVAVGLDEPGFDPIEWGWMVCLDTNSVLLWDKKYTIKGISPHFGGMFSDVIETSDKSLLVVGSIHDQYPLDSFAARDNIWLIKTDLNGCIINEECQEFNNLTIAVDLASKYEELKIFPNPVNDLLYISLHSSNEHFITIFNSKGHIMEKIKGNGPLIEITMKNYLKGTYFIQALSSDSCFRNTFIVIN